MAMEILEVCKVSPPVGSVRDMCLPLTFFDLVWLRFPPTETLFFYETPCHFSFIVPKLKHSLSLTLQYYSPLCGNLVWPPSAPNPIISYNKKSDAVLFTVAQSCADFYHYYKSNRRETQLFHPLVAQIAADSNCQQVPLFATKVTFFPGKGFCIGISGHHAAFDGTSSFVFLKLWASMSKFGERKNLEPETLPIFDKKPIRDRYTHLETLYIHELLKQNGQNPKSLSMIKFERLPGKVRGTFQLSGSDVRILKEFVCARKELREELRISSFLVTFAYLIVCSVKAKRLMKNKVRFSIVADHRSRLEPPQPANYFGNCLGFVSGEVEVEEAITDDGIIAVVYAVHKTLKSLDDGFLEGADKWLSYDDGDMVNISMAGSPKMDLYSLDFGWGRPRKIDAPSIDKTGSISLVKSRDGEGVEIELSLEKHEIERFAFEFTQGLSRMHLRLAAL